MIKVFSNDQPPKRLGFATILDKMWPLILQSASNEELPGIDRTTAHSGLGTQPSHPSLNANTWSNEIDCAILVVFSILINEWWSAY